MRILSFLLLISFVSSYAMENSPVLVKTGGEDKSSIQSLDNGIYVTNNSDEPVEIGKMCKVADQKFLYKIIFLPLKIVQPQTVAFLSGMNKNFYFINGELRCWHREEEDFQGFILAGITGDSSYQKVGRLYDEKVVAPNCSGMLKIDDEGYFLIAKGNERLMRKQPIQNANSYSVEKYTFFDILKKC